MNGLGATGAKMRMMGVSVLSNLVRVAVCRTRGRGYVLVDGAVDVRLGKVARGPWKEFKVRVKLILPFTMSDL